MSPWGKIGGCIRGNGKRHGITDSQIEVQAEKCSQGGHGCGEWKALLGQLLKDEPLGCKARKGW